MKKIVYNKSNGAEVIAYEDPKVSGRYALPSGSVDVEPPTFNSKTQTCSWDGSQWVIVEIPQPEPEDEAPVKTYVDKRAKEYGTVQEQIEFITENGLEAWQTKVSEIKSKYPKPE